VRLRLRVGIGVGIGGLIGLAVCALKHFKIWPFNKVGRENRASDDEDETEEVDEGKDEEGEEVPTQSSARRLRRRHARQWTMV
jgi:hypothetical protein